jgi:hypothetical protein
MTATAKFPTWPTGLAAAEVIFAVAGALRLPDAAPATTRMSRSWPASGGPPLTPRPYFCPHGPAVAAEIFVLTRCDPRHRRWARSFRPG